MFTKKHILTPLSFLIFLLIIQQSSTSDFSNLMSCKDFMSKISSDNETQYIFNVIGTNNNKNLTLGLDASTPSDFLTCSSNLTLEFPINTTTKHPGLNRTILVEIESVNINLTTTGSIKVENEYYGLDEYCVKRITDTNLSIEICKPNCGSNGFLCVPKCCSIGKSITFLSDGSPIGCQDSGPQLWSPTLYKSAHVKLGNVSHGLKHHYTLPKPDAFKNCSRSVWPLKTLKFDGDEMLERTPWRFLTDGSLTYFAKRTWSKLRPSANYCLDGLVANYDLDENYSGDELDQALLICLKEEAVTNSLSYVYVTAMLIAATFLFMTAMVYILLWDQQTVHGWTVFSFVVSMFFLNIFLATAHVLGKTKTNAEFSGSTSCYANGLLAHFFFLSTFCWMTLLNFDLFWTFRTLRPQGSGKSKGIKRYLIFFAFAWCVPLSVIITGLVLTHLFSDVEESEVILPEYGQTTCYLSGIALGPYLYYIIGCLIFTNIILISITFTAIFRLKKSTNTAVHSSSRDQQSFKLFLKLFVIMGVTWILEFISWFDTSYDVLPWYWILIDMINVLQAIAIFIIFVCKRKILVQLQMKYPLIQKLTPKCLNKKKKGNNNITPHTSTMNIHGHLRNNNGNGWRKRFEMEPHSTNSSRSTTISKLTTTDDDSPVSAGGATENIDHENSDNPVTKL